MHQDHRLVDEPMMNQVLRRERIGTQTDVIASEAHILDDQHASMRVQIDGDAAQALERLSHDLRAPGRGDRIGER